MNASKSEGALHKKMSLRGAAKAVAISAVFVVFMECPPGWVRRRRGVRANPFGGRGGDVTPLTNW